MIRICPNPIPWNNIYKKLKEFASSHSCTPFLPPPLILSAWWYSNDIEKKNRWDLMVNWANINGCIDIVQAVPDEDYYFVEEMSTDPIGPMDGPVYREWNSDPKIRPTSNDLDKYMHILTSHWLEIVGLEAGSITRPIKFTGTKARRLLVWADNNHPAPWGNWFERSNDKAKRITFTKFRTAINAAITPHEVDHIDFMV